jgi:prolyl 4-hydroxylase
MPPVDRSTVAARATALAQRGAVAEAYGLLVSAIAAGDAEAAATLADWRLAGDPIRRDLAEARELYGKAAAFGIDEAEPPYLALLANGAGGSGRKWHEALERLAAGRRPLARRQHRLLKAMELDADGDPTALSEAIVLHPAPLIERRPIFLSPEECRYLIDRALPMLEPAVVINPHTGQQMRDPMRTARGAGFPFVLEDPALHAINRRIAAATGTRYEQGEPLQVLCYDAGEEYKLHSDALPAGASTNQRIATFLVALNADYEGGETTFPRLGLAWRGAVGEALHFRNVDAAGAPAPAMWHTGAPVRRRRKFLLSKWLRAAPLDLSGPPGRPF